MVSIMLKEETNNYSILAALHSPLTPVLSKTPPLLPPPFPTPAPTIAADVVGMLYAAFPDLSIKFQLNIILNRK